jgi:tetraacyldisaccharide 4'-kinase
VKSLRYLLFPFSLLYGAILGIRNLLFDLGIFKSYTSSLPVICIGNLAAGGTGKTPHIEYLIRLLKEGRIVATLSRGYGRTSKGFRYVSDNSSANETGDEPLQFRKKFRNEIIVAVDSDRKAGIQKITAEHPDVNVFLLDDAFQHRWVKCGLNILLTEYAQPFFKDYLIPAGNLRESGLGLKRADVVIITKCPAHLSETEKQVFRTRIPNKPLFFSCVRYGQPLHFKDNTPADVPDKSTAVLLLTGIANHRTLAEYLLDKCHHLELLSFPDHHAYSPKDIQTLKARFEQIPGKNKIIITTEKDAMRLKQPEIAKMLNNLPLFYIPIRVAFNAADTSAFDQIILDYVTENQKGR